MLLSFLCKSTFVTMNAVEPTIASALHFPCFHDCKSYDRSLNISSCKYLLYDNTITHIIALKDAVNYDTLPQLSSVTYQFNKNDLVSEVHETVSIQPLCTLYQLDKRTDVNVALQLASQMVEYFVSALLPSERRFSNLSRESDCIHFLQTNASFALNSKTEARFIILNRHNLITTPIPEKQKARKLITQLYAVSNLIKVFIFNKNKKVSQKTLQPCNKSICKLTNYSPRFLNTYNDNNLLYNFHSIYCNSNSQLDIFQNLYLAIPVSPNILIEAIHYVQNS